MLLEKIMRQKLFSAVLPLVFGLTLLAPAPAIAATWSNPITYEFFTKSACETAQRQFISSWTKVTQSCTYTPLRWYFKGVQRTS